MYSFCYKTEVNILAEKTLDSSLKEDARLPSDLDGSSLKNDLTYRAGSCSPRNETGGTRDTDTSGETEVQSEVHSEKLFPMERIEEETEIASKCQIEENFFTREETKIVRCVDVEERTLIVFENDSRTSRNPPGDDDASKATDDEKTDSSRACGEDSTWNVEEKGVKEEAITEIEKELKERTDQDSCANSQRLHRVFRGDSRDSGIADCISNLSTSSQQVNELGISSIKEEDTDIENNNGNMKNAFQSIDRRASMDEVTEVSAGAESMEVSDPKRDTKGSNEVATQSGITKASRETNRPYEGVFNILYHLKQTY